MKKINKLIVLGLLAVVMVSCSVSRPVLVTDNVSDKEGVSEYSVVLGIFRPKDADASIVTAAKNGGITKISTVDFVIESKFFKTTYKTVVTGE